MGLKYNKLLYTDYIIEYMIKKRQAEPLIELSKYTGGMEILKRFKAEDAQFFTEVADRIGFNYGVGYDSSIEELAVKYFKYKGSVPPHLLEAAMDYDGDDDDVREKIRETIFREYICSQDTSLAPLMLDLVEEGINLDDVSIFRAKYCSPFFELIDNDEAYADALYDFIPPPLTYKNVEGVNNHFMKNFSDGIPIVKPHTMHILDPLLSLRGCTILGKAIIRLSKTIGGALTVPVIEYLMSKCPNYDVYKAVDGKKYIKKPYILKDAFRSIAKLEGDINGIHSMFEDIRGVVDIDLNEALYYALYHNCGGKNTLLEIVEYFVHIGATNLRMFLSELDSTEYKKGIIGGEELLYDRKSLIAQRKELLKYYGKQ